MRRTGIPKRCAQHPEQPPSYIRVRPAYRPDTPGWRNGVSYACEMCHKAEIVTRYTRTGALVTERREPKPEKPKGKLLSLSDILDEGDDLLTA